MCFCEMIFGYVCSLRKEDEMILRVRGDKKKSGLWFVRWKGILCVFLCFKKKDLNMINNFFWVWNFKWFVDYF